MRQRAVNPNNTRRYEESPMARIIVTTDETAPPEATVLLDERVYSVHLDDNHAAAQLIERLAWAVGDAESSERPRRPFSARAAGASRRRVRATGDSRR
jgi:hypothetical protein